MSKVKTWDEISQEAKERFLGEGDWMNHFSKEIIEEAADFYAAILGPDEYGRGRSAHDAWTYALGASRFMKKD